MTALEERLFAEIDRAGPLDLLSALIRIPSHRGIEKQEAALATALASHLEQHGLEPRLDEVADGRPNLLCTVGSGAPGPHLLLCGHMDTVPLNAGEPGFGFSGELRDGMVLGRGAVDMKGALAAKAATLVALARCSLPHRGRVTLAAVIDEEMESLGAEALIADGFTADGAIVGEPTRNRVCLGHKGLEWLEIIFRGAAAHGGTPEAGINAIAAAARFLDLARTELAARWRNRVDPLLGSPTFNVGTIAGGDQPSTVAALCTLQADRRSVPGEDYALISGELQELMRRVESEMPGLTSELRRLPGGMATLEHVALSTPADDPVALAAAAAYRQVRGVRAEFGAFPAWTDGALLSAFGDIPTIIMGPGDLAVAHSPREAVPTAEVLEAARLYAVTALEFCDEAA
ncbi:MAG: M20 family metallopeptidase [Acidobacteriota bacterium]|nr:M20 family metallopeptidase [Acidobacteriota bacterium]